MRYDTNLLRSIAIIMIVNSHMDFLYPIPYLGTGGAIGNALFFMLSSFGLFISYQKKPYLFATYFINRINRVYPVVWGELLTIYIPFTIFIDKHGQNIGINEIIYYLGCFIFPMHHWFLCALMIYYALIYPIMNNINDKKIYLAILLSAVCYIYVYSNLVDLTKWVVEAEPTKYLSYFMIFLSGLIIARRNDRMIYCGKIDWAILMFCLGISYAHKYLMTKQLLLSMQFIQQIILFPIVYYSLKIVRSPAIQRFMFNKAGFAGMVKYISDRTLEIYIIHGYFIVVVINYRIAFPYNAIFVIILTLITAEVLNIISKRFIQVLIPNKYIQIKRTKP